MAGDIPWFKFFSREWLAVTGGLAPSDKGILTDLLAIQHERGEPVPYNTKTLAARCRATPKTFGKAIETLVESGLLHFEGNSIWSEMMQRQIEFEQKNSLTRKTAAEKRWQKTKQNQGPTHTGAMLYKRESEDIDGMPREGASPSSINSTEITAPDRQINAPDRGDKRRYGAEAPAPAPEPIALKASRPGEPIICYTQNELDQLLDFLVSKSAARNRNGLRQTLMRAYDAATLTKQDALSIVENWGVIHERGSTYE